MDLLEQIQSALPFLALELREEIVQDIAVLVLEGEIDEAGLLEGIRKHLPALKRKYPSAQFQLSLDAPVSADEGAATLGDFIHKAGVLPKRRGRKRKNARSRASDICRWCKERFYFKRPGRILKKRDRKRLAVLESLDPGQWTRADITLLRVGNPDLLNKHRKSVNRTAHAGHFCSQRCSAAFASTCPKKMPARERLLEDVAAGLTPGHIRTKYKVAVTTVSKALVRAGVRQSVPLNIEECIEDGCQEAPFKIKHSKNGAMYGRRCREHQKRHFARLERERYRKANNIQSDKFRKLSQCVIDGCERVPAVQRRICAFHRSLQNAERSRKIYREKHNTPQEKWRVLDG